MTVRLTLAAIFLSFAPLSAMAAADCAAFKDKFARTEALDKQSSQALEQQRTADACRMMAEGNSIRADILKTTHDDCYTAFQSEFAIKMNLGSTEAAAKAMCQKP